MYDADTLQRAFFGDEVERIQLEHHNLFSLTSTRVPSYGVLPDSEVSMSLDESDVNNAIMELAAARGISITDLAEQVFVFSGGQHDTQARAEAVVELAGMDPRELAELGLTAKGKAKKVKNDLDDDEDEYDEDPDIHVSENQGNQGPTPRPGKRKVRVRTRGQTPFGGEGGAPDGGSGASGMGDGGSMAASAPRRGLVRAGDGSYMTVALSEDEQWAADEIARLTAEHPTVGLASMRDSRNYSAVKFDNAPGVTPNVNKHYPFEVYDVGARDDGDPSDPEGGNTASVIARLQAAHPEFFQERPYGNTNRIAPKSVSQRRREQARATTRPENLITR
jgi:hypothetical protein